jgi:hypothetical protein
MALGIKIFTLFLTAIAFSGAMLSLNAQSRNSSRSASAVTTSGSERTEKMRTTNKPAARRRTTSSQSPETEKPADPAPIGVPVDVIINVPPLQQIVEIVTNSTTKDDSRDDSDWWPHQWKVGYIANAASYGIGTHIIIPAGIHTNSELFVRMGVILFSKSSEFVIDGISHEAESGLLSLALMLKTIHYSTRSSFGEYRVYSIVGGGPVFGSAYPADFDEGIVGGHTRWSLAGEFFGAFGTEFLLYKNIGYYAEVGFSYLSFAGRSFSTEQQFLTPTLTIGVRFY